MNKRKHSLYVSFLVASHSQAALICKLTVGSEAVNNDAQYYSPLNVVNVDGIHAGAYFNTQQTPNNYLKLNPNNVFLINKKGSDPRMIKAMGRHFQMPNLRKIKITNH
ncbi:hypothetical protein L1D15_21705 [Vibrio sp. Isolate25]|uniref:hypothetical protein n=1 Tax=Vibrio sp. Isolate25 TaxID=2908535 RepID=UPI001EFDBEA7|nr:hypothetical protein [Vibrio sp. Isolate25]MCG9599309.1 hypothetical protein [Vibrio sp. Isolate25]